MRVFSAFVFEGNVVWLLFPLLGIAGLTQGARVRAACGEGRSCWWSIFAGLYGRKKELIIKYCGGKKQSMDSVSAVKQFSLVR